MTNPQNQTPPGSSQSNFFTDIF